MARDPVYITEEHKHNIKNYSVAAQTPAAATATYITGSQIYLPEGLKAGDIFKWTFDLTKTAAGVASSTISIVFGTAGTTADTARVSFTKPAGDASVDAGVITIYCIVRSLHASTGTAVGNMVLTHALKATGHANLGTPCVTTVSGNFATTTPKYVGLVITSGADDAITIQTCTAEVLN